MAEDFKFREGFERPQPVIRDRGKREVEKKANTLIKLKVEYVNLGELKPNSYNPNRQSEKDFELLCRSMTEDGFTQPIVALLNDKIIVDGEHRWRAAKKLGFVSVPVVFVDMTPEQMRISTLRHNRARGSEDVELSAELLRDLRELGALDWAQDSLMIGDEEMRILLDDVPVVDELASEQFSEAWVQTTQNQDNVSTYSREEKGNSVVAGTKEVVKVVSEATDRMEKASSFEDKQKILAEMERKIYRIAISFTGDEAQLVKKVLGLQPAIMLVELCRKYADFDFGASEIQEVVNG